MYIFNKIILCSLLISVSFYMVNLQGTQHATFEELRSAVHRALPSPAGVAAGMTATQISLGSELSESTKMLRGGITLALVAATALTIIPGDGQERFIKTVVMSQVGATFTGYEDFEAQWAHRAYVAGISGAATLLLYSGEKAYKKWVNNKQG